MKQYAVIGILVKDRSVASREIHQVLSEYGDYIIGRMGVRNREDDDAIIALIIEGNTDIIGAITGKIGNIPGVKVKAGMLKKDETT
jgi:putative iron-only hydrogenase system regulator